MDHSANSSCCTGARATRVIKATVFFVGSVIDTAILTSIVSTQLVLADVRSFGLSVSVGDRINATLHDILGVGPPLLVLIGLSFLVAFTVARHAQRIIGGSRAIWFSIAGFASVPVTLMLLKLALGGTMLASARTPLGMFLVACCCMAGAYCYVWLTERYGNAGGDNA